MNRLIFGLDDMVAQWASTQIDGQPDFRPCTAIGVAIGETIIAGVVYNNYRDHCIEWSIAATDKRWLTRRVLRAIMAYPFIQLGVRRLQSTCAKRDRKTRGQVLRLGFKYEGTARQAWPGGGDACCYSMLRHECRWLAAELSGEPVILNAEPIAAPAYVN